jgi:hypothetical protein
VSRSHSRRASLATQSFGTLLLLVACEGSMSSTDVDAGFAPTDAATDVGFVDDAATDDAALARDADVVPPDVGHDRLDAGPPPVDAGPPFVPDDRPSSARHTPIPVGTDGSPSGYYEYLPPTYGNGEPHPLVVFWHGIGENGNGDSELDRVLRGGPPRLIERDQWDNERPFIVLSAQHPGGGCPAPDEIRDFLAHALSTYRVDPSRVYLTGLSCGAIGSWNYLGRYVDDTPVVAAVLIAGNGAGAWSNQGCDLTRVAIWGVHGDADDVVAPSGTTVPMGHLLECPTREEQILTIYPGVGHDSWSRTYDGSAGHDVWSWLLDQSR